MAYLQKGGCQCGLVNCTVNDAPIFTYACHCHDCQKRTGSAFSMGMVLTSSGIAISGELQAWSRQSDEGNTNTRYSCKSCGNIIYGVSTATPDIVKLQPGLLENSHTLEPEVHIWMQSAQQWLQLPGDVPQYQRQPDDMMEVVAAALSYRESKQA